jgi:hypothetical protein
MLDREHAKKETETEAEERRNRDGGQGARPRFSHMHTHTDLSQETQHETQQVHPLLCQLFHFAPDHLHHLGLPHVRACMHGRNVRDGGREGQAAFRISL